MLGHVTTVPTVAPTLATMIGLGVGIDYALFIVTRHFRGLEDGLPVDESIARAAATSGGAVFFAGGTVTIALVSLAVARIPLVTTMGLMAGDRSGRGGARGADAAAGDARADRAAHQLAARARAALRSKGARRAVGQVGTGHRPAPGACRPGRAGDPDPAHDPAAVAHARPAGHRRALHLDDRPPGLRPDQPRLGPGVNGPLLIAVSLGTPAEPATPSSSQSASAQGDPRATDPRLQTLQHDIAITSGVAAVTPIQIDKAGTTAYFNAIATTGPAEKATADLVERLRSNVIPEAEKGTDMHADVGGSTAGYVDLASTISSKLPLQILVVIVLSFALLMLAFRTVVVPPQAALMNLLSIAASYGVLTAIFQYGWLSGLVGLSGPVPIVSYVPLFMFAILFGLSMDYEVFLVSQIEEHVHAGEDNRRSVVLGLVTSARVITAAAMIMVFVFGSFVLNGDPTIKQFGVGLAVAMVLDSTVVRCLLVPALMVLVGESNWWMPRWLEPVVPQLSIEGAEFFDAQDAERI